VTVTTITNVYNIPVFRGFHYSFVFASVKPRKHTRIMFRNGWTFADAVMGLVPLQATAIVPTERRSCS